MKKKSKQPKTPECEDEADKISNMPDEVLQLILSCIPSTEEVMRTSILSRRWRYLWTLVPSIDIDCTRGPLDLETNGFREFVNWVLLNKPLDLDSFHLRCGVYYSMSTIRQWIDAAVKRKVKLLDLMFFPLHEESSEVVIELPHCLVTNGSLEVLKLCLLHGHLCLPKITGFQALRVLELREVKLKDVDDLVKRFLESSCPMLEDLSLIDCIAPNTFVISSSKLSNLRIDTRLRYIIESLVISCPKLEFLMLTGPVAWEFQFQNLYSLKKAAIHVESLFDRELQELFDREVDASYSLGFFATISHVEYLSINVYCIRQCFDPEVDSPLFLLPNIKTLEVSMDWYKIDALIPFLKCLPHLESLHLIIPKHIYNVDQWNLEKAETINILTRHLKKVEFLEFDEVKPKLVVARALLEHGNELEEMVFSWGNEAAFHKRSMETMKQVSNFYKASSTVKLTTVFNPPQANS